MKSFDGTKSRRYGHCLVAGVRRSPRRVTKSMTNKEILRRTSMRPFVKVINWNHMMPTRFVAAPGSGVESPALAEMING